MYHPKGKKYGGADDVRIAHRMGPRGEEFWDVYQDCWRPTQTTEPNDETDLVGSSPEFCIAYEETWAEPRRAK